MNDPEVMRRHEAMAHMSEFCDCIEHATATRLNGASAQIDVLCRPHVESLSCFTLAIEVKAHQLVGDRQLGPWLKQASDYVGAIPQNGWPRLAASFVWLVGMTLHPSDQERLRMDGMLQLAQHFRVGRAYETHSGLTLVFGPSADIFLEKRGGWTNKAAQLLGAKRVSGGMRKPPSTQLL
jgi:hypothetical protein